MKPHKKRRWDNPDTVLRVRTAQRRDKEVVARRTPVATHYPPRTSKVVTIASEEERLPVRHSPATESRAKHSILYRTVPHGETVSLAPSAMVGKARDETLRNKYKFALGTMDNGTTPQFNGPLDLDILHPKEDSPEKYRTSPVNPFTLITPPHPNTLLSRTPAPTRRTSELDFECHHDVHRNTQSHNLDDSMEGDSHLARVLAAALKQKDRELDQLRGELEYDRAQRKDDETRFKGMLAQWQELTQELKSLQGNSMTAVQLPSRVARPTHSSDAGTRERRKSRDKHIQQHTPEPPDYPNFQSADFQIETEATEPITHDHSLNGLPPYGISGSSSFESKFQTSPSRRIEEEYYGNSQQPHSNSHPMVTGLKLVGSTVVDSALHVSYVYDNEDHFDREGDSRIQWYTVDKSGYQEKIMDGPRSLDLTTPEVGYFIKVEVTPKSVSGCTGFPTSVTTETVVTKATMIPPVVLAHKLIGDPTDGAVLTATVHVQYHGGMDPEDKIEWYRGNALMPNQGLEYGLTGDDVGHRIKFKYTPRVGGLDGKPVTATSPAIISSYPIVSNVQLTQAFCGRAVKCTYNYTGGQQGNTSFVWWKSLDGKEWDRLEESHSSYYATADDLSHFIKCEVTPVTLNGVDGETVETTTFVELSHKYKNELQKVLKEGVKGFNVKSEATEKQQIIIAPKLIRVYASETQKLLYSAKWSTETGIRLQTETENGFYIHLGKGTQRVFSITRKDTRDLLVLIFRIFHAMSVPAVATPIVGEQVAHLWKKGEFTKIVTHAHGSEAYVTRQLPLSNTELESQNKLLQECSFPLFMAAETLRSVMGNSKSSGKRGSTTSQSLDSPRPQSSKQPIVPPLNLTHTRGSSTH